MKFARVRFSAGLMATALLLAGCSGQAGIKALDRDATADDVLPAFVIVPEPANAETARLLATRNGIQYFAVQSDDLKTACLAVVQGDESTSWQMGCGQNNGSGKILDLQGAGSLSASLWADGSDTGTIEPGWIKLTDNVLVPSGKSK